MPKATPAIDRVLARIVYSDTPFNGSLCWIFTGGRQGGGRYGVVVQGSRSDGTRRYSATHRVTYEELVGPIPEGMVLDHLCRMTLCCNPSHLEPVTQQENVLRGVAPTAANARKTHCASGHWLGGANLKPGRWRNCVACHRENAKRQREAIKAAHKHLGLTQREYTDTYGHSKAKALEVVGVG